MSKIIAAHRLFVCLTTPALSGCAWLENPDPVVFCSSSFWGPVRAEHSRALSVATSDVPAELSAGLQSSLAHTVTNVKHAGFQYLNKYLMLLATKSTYNGEPVVLNMRKSLIKTEPLYYLLCLGGPVALHLFLKLHRTTFSSQSARIWDQASRLPCILNLKPETLTKSKNDALAAYLLEVVPTAMQTFWLAADGLSKLICMCTRRLPRNPVSTLMRSALLPRSGFFLP